MHSNRLRLSRLLVALVAVLAATLAVAPTPAHAQNDKGSGGHMTRLEQRAYYVAFEFRLSRFKRIAGQDYFAQHGLGGYAKPIDKKLDWNHDGCSVPWYGDAALVKQYAKKNFTSACNRHDFGYRNYGSDNAHGPHLDPTEARRKKIDDRLAFEMHAICAKKSGASGTICRKYAGLMYRAVRARGKSHFFK